MKKGEVIRFDFTFTFQVKKYSVKATMFQVYNYPQIYVSVELDKKQPTSFTFYKIDQPGQLLFWFDNHGHKELAAKAIAKALEKHFSKN
jgi:hypothetical protein